MVFPRRVQFVSVSGVLWSHRLGWYIRAVRPSPEDDVQSARSQENVRGIHLGSAGAT
jgi:hypothetical protein